MEEEFGVEVRHPSGVCPERIIPCGEYVWNLEVVGETARIPLYFLCEHGFSFPVYDVYVYEVGQGVRPVLGRIHEVCLEPNFVSGPVVGFVQMKPQLLLMAGTLRLEKIDDTKRNLCRIGGPQRKQRKDNEY